jgi:L-lactate utilization protein LutC
MYNTLPTQESINKTAENLKTNGIEPIVVANANEALEKIKSLIPSGVSVMNGTSKTLEQIGYIDYLKSGQHPWNNLHKAIVEETDPIKQGELRRQALLSEYYLGSVHALSETGEFLIASNTGSQLPHVVFSSTHLIFVVGAQKIVPSLSEAMKRLEDYVVPLEDTRSKEAYKVGTQLSKILIFKKENPMVGRKVSMIIVSESLGF